MANNRMYIRCKECGATIFIAKSFGTYHINCGTDKECVEYVEELAEFFSEHSHCYEDNREEKIKEHNKFYYPEINIEEEVKIGNNFEICYEEENFI